MNAKFIAIFLYVFFMWKAVSSKQKCNITQYCNVEDCNSHPLLSESYDENKLDRACITNKCIFDYAGSGSIRKCVLPGNCTEGQYCSNTCNIQPYVSENHNCKVGLNCDKTSKRCIKKPRCKDGEYCKRGDCKRDEKPTIPDDDACEDGSECNGSFKCVKKSTMKYATNTTTDTEEESKSSNWWIWLIFGFVFGMLLVFGILGTLWYFLYYKNNKKKIMKKKIIKEKKLSKVKEAEVENEVKKRKSDSKETEQKSSPEKRKSKLPSFSTEIEKSKVTIPKKRKSTFKKDRKILKQLGEW